MGKKERMKKQMWKIAGEKRENKGTKKKKRYRERGMDAVRDSLVFGLTGADWFLVQITNMGLRIWCEEIV